MKFVATIRSVSQFDRGCVTGLWRLKHKNIRLVRHNHSTIGVVGRHCNLPLRQILGSNVANPHAVGSEYLWRRTNLEMNATVAEAIPTDSQWLWLVELPQVKTSGCDRLGVKITWSVPMSL